MLCLYCRLENSDDSLYCSACGAELERLNNVNKIYQTNNSSISQTNNSSKNANISLVCGVICLVCAFLFNILCFAPGIVSIIYAIKYKKESGKFGVGFGLSLGGMIYSFVVFLIFIFLMCVTASINIPYENDYYNDYDTEFTYNL